MKRVCEVDCGYDNPSDLSKKGPILVVNIHSPSQSSDLLESDVWALVDTGATNSCVDLGLARRLNLRVVDKMQMHGVNGMFMAELYAAKIDVPDLKFMQVGPFAGVDLEKSKLGCSVLIGRSFLKNFEMKYEGKTGKVVIAG